MADTSKLRDMLQDLINDRHEQASVNLHDYLVDKMRDVAGTAQAAASTIEDEDTGTITDDEEVDELNLDTTE